MEMVGDGITLELLAGYSNCQCKFSWNVWKLQVLGYSGFSSLSDKTHTNVAFAG